MPPPGGAGLFQFRPSYSDTKSELPEARLTSSRIPSRVRCR
jgi:hypothetical protein